jgi:hypothetical protein
LEHLIVVPLDQSKLEAVLGRVDFQGSRFSIAIQAVNTAALDLDKINRLVQCPNDTAVTMGLLVGSFRGSGKTYPFSSEYLTWFKVE